MSQVRRSFTRMAISPSAKYQPGPSRAAGRGGPKAKRMYPVGSTILRWLEVDRIVHPERVEDLCLEEGPERLTGSFLYDQARNYEVRVAVFVLRVGLEIQVFSCPLMYNCGRFGRCDPRRNRVVLRRIIGVTGSVRQEVTNSDVCRICELREPSRDRIIHG